MARNLARRMTSRQRRFDCATGGTPPHLIVLIDERDEPELAARCPVFAPEIALTLLEPESHEERLAARTRRVGTMVDQSWRTPPSLAADAIKRQAQRHGVRCGQRLLKPAPDWALAVIGRWVAIAISEPRGSQNDG